MEYPYKDQKKAKKTLSVGDYIYFADAPDECINSAEVAAILPGPADKGPIIMLANVNGEGEGMMRYLKDITLFRDHTWPEDPQESENDHEEEQ